MTFHDYVTRILEETMPRITDPALIAAFVRREGLTLRPPQEETRLDFTHVQPEAHRQPPVSEVRAPNANGPTPQRRVRDLVPQPVDGLLDQPERTAARHRGRSAYGQFLDRLEALGCEFCDVCYSYQWAQTDEAGGHTCRPPTDGPVVPFGVAALTEPAIYVDDDGQHTIATEEDA